MTLSSWTANNDCCRWECVRCDNVTGRVIELDLSRMRMQVSGGLHPALFNLTSLRSLSLHDNNFCGSPLPESGFERLTQLRILDLSGCNLTGPITLFNNGDILPSLERVRLSTNSLSGTIPVTIFTRPALQVFDISMNNLSGPIGEFHNPSAMLNTIDLGSNQLTGAVPTSFSQLTALYRPALDSNNFTGTLDLGPYFRQRNLGYLSASDNSLLSATTYDHGSNSSSYNKSGISILELSGCSLTRIPGALRYLPQLFDLDLSNNLIGGRIPDWIWRSVTFYLDLSHNKFTAVQIPANIYIDGINLSFNKLRGAVSLPSSGSYIDYSNNGFSSIPPGNFRLGPTYINLANNKLSGPLPYVECNRNDNTTIITILDLSGNNLSGSIPPYLLKGCNQLSVLSLRDNRLSGAWPDEMVKDCTLNIIDLHGNRLHGPLPRSLVNCGYLKVLDVGGNDFVDVFPTWLGNLRLLLLRSNKFYGPVSIPPAGLNHSTTSYFPSVQIIELAENGFTGVIPSELLDSFELMIHGPSRAQIDSFNRFSSSMPYQKVQLEFVVKQRYMRVLRVSSDVVVIDLSNNRFSGPIPKTVGKLTGLLMLNVSHNAFGGGIPGELGRLARIESLDLSWNNLTGGIPRTALEWLNLSGSIPSGNQFSTFTSSSFQGGNPGLYGCPLPVRCNLTQALSPPTLQVPTRAADDHNFEVIVFCLASCWLWLWAGLRAGNHPACDLHLQAKENAASQL